jgi:hypothetical protein
MPYKYKSIEQKIGRMGLKKAVKAVTPVKPKAKKSTRKEVR